MLPIVFLLRVDFGFPARIKSEPQSPRSGHSRMSSGFWAVRSIVRASLDPACHVRTPQSDFNTSPALIRQFRFTDADTDSFV